MSCQSCHTRDPEGLSKNEDAYRLYFSSGLYDRRYPSPNRTTWKRIKRFLTPDTVVLDYGCGSGRYTMRLRGQVARTIGYDVSPTALESLRNRAAREGWHSLSVLGPEPSALEAHIAAEGPVDLVLCLFGVLGHIIEPPTRARALQRMRDALKTGQGRLLISVPNRARRFRAEQAETQSTMIHYQRTTDAGEKVMLSYQLFDPEALVAELQAAGFSVKRIGCESVLPENWLLHSAALQLLDSFLTPLCPARWGYGIYAEAVC